MAPAYPKTDSDDDRPAAARYHAMNNVFFLEAAMHGRYPKAFVEEPPYELGFKAGDEKLLHAPLDWVGFHYYTRASSRTRARSNFSAEVSLAVLRLRTMHRAAVILTHASAPPCPQKGHLPTPASKYGRSACTTW